MTLVNKLEKEQSDLDKVRVAAWFHSSITNLIYDYGGRKYSSTAKCAMTEVT
jgi:hypothetical protein